jgi:hypothetical protein
MINSPMVNMTTAHSKKFDTLERESNGVPRLSRATRPEQGMTLCESLQLPAGGTTELKPHYSSSNSCSVAEGVHSDVHCTRSSVRNCH